MCKRYLWNKVGIKMTSVSLKCDVCGKDFSSKSTLSTHQKTAKFCLAKKASISSQSQSQSQSSQTQASPPVNHDFINEIKRNYEDTIRDRDERISTLESLIEKMEEKIDKYQATITAIVLNSFGYRIRRQPCSDPACEGCRAEEAAEEARLNRKKQEQADKENEENDKEDDKENEEDDKDEEDEEDNDENKE
jgi:hypothetical protein